MEEINIETMKIGDTVKLTLYPPATGNYKRKVGKVIYIHPHKRFFTLDYDGVRESFVPRGDHIECSDHIKAY